VRNPSIVEEAIRLARQDIARRTEQRIIALLTPTRAKEQPNHGKTNTTSVVSPPLLGMRLLVVESDGARNVNKTHVDSKTDYREHYILIEDSDGTQSHWCCHSNTCCFCISVLVLFIMIYFVVSYPPDNSIPLL